jgi:NMD protein affecting ribosome stability and mRNA decay
LSSGKICVKCGRTQASFGVLCSKCYNNWDNFITKYRKTETLPRAKTEEIWDLWMKEKEKEVFVFR